MMSAPQILILDLCPRSVENELRKADIEFAATCVTSKEDFVHQIANVPPDIILSDYSLPQFTGLEALRLVKEQDCEAPFILVSSSQSEEAAVECMKEGATDYILKSNLRRLPSAVLNALKRRVAEKEKAEALEALRKSEEQFLQAQKLEAVGRLAGGIAHDFNNLLTAIIGYSDVCFRRSVGNEPMRRDLKEIMKASESAASLTRHLLAFSRKQVMRPKVINLNALITDMEKMLPRIIGEDVSLRTNLNADVGNVEADPHQLEQVILNLMVNARDAMPMGGKLTIETANVYLDKTFARTHVSVEPGPYVMLAVSDTGSGIDEETQKYIFEPFFTTKETGKGTGLGLSTVYGIVKQSGGNIWVYSEVGKGTTFKIYLPRIATREEARILETMVEAPGGWETILLVEDADAVRGLVKQVLETSGYHVLEGANGRAALSLGKCYAEEIHLLLTDVVMPDMSGKDLADRLTALNPCMDVLYMSGYTDDAIIQHGVLSPGTNFMQKPFTPTTLTTKVREVLNSRQNSRNHQPATI